MAFDGSGDKNIAGSCPAVIPDSMPGAEQEGPERQPLRIMLLGKSGVGKSSSGNTILGRHVFKSDMKLVRVTNICEKEVGIVKDVPVDMTGKVEDVPVAVIDTPGLFETERNKDDIVREILKCVTLHEPGPHAFVLVVPVGRMTREDRDTNALIETKFGPRVWDYTIVLFTHGDRLDGKTINDVITESDVILRNFLHKCGGFHVFNNKDPQDQVQVTSFIEKIHTLVALNGGGHYHTDLYPEEERRIRKRQESILAERDADIRRRERELQERHEGKELEMKKKLLWKKEEDQARLAAEKETGGNIFRFMLFLGGLLGLLAGWSLSVPDPWLLAVTAIWTLIFFKDCQSVLRKISTFCKKR